MKKYKITLSLTEPMMVELWEKLFTLAATDPETWEPIINSAVFDFDFQKWREHSG